MRTCRVRSSAAPAAARRAADQPLKIDQFRPESSAHRPQTEVEIDYLPAGLRLCFRVKDRYVRCMHTMPQAQVCKDSCVEFFARPRAELGYFNFEANCGGNLLAYYITDWRRTEPGGPLTAFTPLQPAELGQIRVSASLPRVIDPELTVPTDWQLEMFIPLTVLAKYVGELGALPGQRWRANFYKCADASSHPHWAAWNPVRELNFHQPEDFGELQFE